MASKFLHVHFHAADKKKKDLEGVGVRPLGLRGARPPRPGAGAQISFHTDEAAARHYLSKVFAQDTRPAVRGLIAPERAEVVPDLRFLGVQSVPLTKTKLVQFDQFRESVPVFGSRATVELDQRRELISVDAEISEVRDVPPVPTLSPKEALVKIEEVAGVSQGSLPAIEPPHLTFFHDDAHDSWHLAYFFRRIPAAPEAFLKKASDRKSRGHGFGRSPRQIHPQLNYLVDAHDGKILLYYSATPMLDTPSRCKGKDDNDQSCDFYGRKVSGEFEMHDPLRGIKTYDLQLGDLDSVPLPPRPVYNNASDWVAINKAAVSAHMNAKIVYDFYKSVLKRDSIDDKGMELVSVANCTLPSEEPPPEWHNAVWWNNRMWYGQERDAGGMLRSFARFLDVIAHELTHGVTESSADLVYYGESGALNESFSDIFGIIIKNWHVLGGNSDVGSWSWEIGAGLGGHGLPLRDMSNPKRTDDPDHMRDFLKTTSDNGGVHTNSNIHNKAAYNVFTAKDGRGHRVFSSEEIAILYYLCLIRLTPIATFSKTLQVLLDVASTYYAGNNTESAKKVQHIKQAYNKVGIT